MNAITTNEIVTRLRNLMYSAAVYMWGADGEVITPEYIEFLKSRYISSLHTPEYYDEKLECFRGKIGVDDVGLVNYLSGSHLAIEDYFKTAHIISPAVDINRNYVWLVYGTKVIGTPRVGIYLGNGKVITISEGSGLVESSYDDLVGCFDRACIPEFITDGDKVLPGVSKVVEHYQTWLNEYARVLGFNGAPVSGYFDAKTLVSSRAVAKQLYGSLTGVCFDSTAEITMKEITDNIYTEFKKDYQIDTYERLMYILCMRLYDIGLLPDFVSLWGHGEVSFGLNFGERLRGMQRGLRAYMLNSRYLDSIAINLSLIAEVLW